MWTIEILDKNVLWNYADSMYLPTPSHVNRIHWRFNASVGKEGSEFQRVRDEIGERIKRFSETGE